MLTKKSKRGFSAIELIISLAVLSLATTAIASMLVYAMRGFSTGVASDSVTDSTTIALQKLGTDIRDGCSATDSGGSDTTSNTLTVTFPALLTDSTTGEKYYDASSSNKTTRSYYVSNGNLVRQSGNSITILGAGVDWAHFHAVNGLVSADLRNTETIVSKDESMQVNGRISLRNYQY